MYIFTLLVELRLTNKKLKQKIIKKKKGTDGEITQFMIKANYLD